MNLSEDVASAIVAHFANLRARWGAVVAIADLIEPTGAFFPDTFAVDPESVHRLLKRMMSYAPLAADIPVEVVFREQDDDARGGGCGGGACGTGTASVESGGAIETDDGYAVLVAVSDVPDATLLTTSLARSVGRLVLHEAEEPVDPTNDAMSSELTAVACGFGVLLLNGACVYKKGCGGMRRHQGTFLSVEELAFALALFVRVHDAKPASVRRHLEVTQRESFDEALSWVDARENLMTRLRDQPEALVDGVLPAETKRGFFSRLFPRREPSLEKALESVAQTAKRKAVAPMPEASRQRLLEAKALVAEALDEL